jgi:hypothetical protein
MKKVKSQAKIARSNSASSDIFDAHYVGLRQDSSEMDKPMSSETIREEEPSYIKLHSERVTPKEYKAKQVGWWLGRVEEVYEDYFTASLEDLHGKKSVAEFSNEEITPTELNLLLSTVRFSYTVTQLDKRSGREYVSKISLSGPSMWTEKDSEKATESYEKLFPEELFDF